MKTIEKKKFEFNEKGHQYFLNGKKMTGCTTIIGILDKPALIQWSANEAVDYITNKAEYDRKENVYKINKEELELGRKAWCRKRDKAGNIGTQTHFWIEQFANSKIKGTEYKPEYESEQVEKMVKKFIEWAEENNVKFLLSEQKLYSEKHWFAGTVDLVVEIRGKKYIADIKTARDIFFSNFLQMAGYHIALEELGKIKDLNGYCVINIPKDFKANGEAKIRTKFLTKNLEQHKQGFKDCLSLYRYVNRIKVDIKTA